MNKVFPTLDPEVRADIQLYVQNQIPEPDGAQWPAEYERVARSAELTRHAREFAADQKSGTNRWAAEIKPTGEILPAAERNLVAGELKR